MSAYTTFRATNLFNEEFGTDFTSRLIKLKEESLELIEAIDSYLENPKEEEMDHLIDEMGDVQAVITHSVSILNMSTEELLWMAIDKVERRKIDPNYKRNNE